MKRSFDLRQFAASLCSAVGFWHFFAVFAAFFLVEVLACCLLMPASIFPLVFGALWASLLTCVIFCLPRLAGRIVFGIVYFFSLLWMLAQVAYYTLFQKMMWLSTMGYAGEGAGYLMDVFRSLPFLWFLALVLGIGAGVLIIVFFPRRSTGFSVKIPYILAALILVLSIFLLPTAKFAAEERKQDTPGISRTIYTGVSNARKLYDLVGIYHTTWRDFWVHLVSPLLPGYRATIDANNQFIEDFFTGRGEQASNTMTGIFAGKNVVLVLMESMDDWMITPDNTPTLWKLMDEGINFTNFYTPGYGSARTLNSEFCMNAGFYLPTSGEDVLNYLDEGFPQAIASQMTGSGYSGAVYHYNTAKFYNRGRLEPALGYQRYVSYSDYVTDKKLLCNDNLLFDLPQVSDDFFRDGQTFNTIITRAAHLGYVYNEIITSYALKEYPEYRGMYPSEELDSAHLKAMLVDKMFARLLAELEARGQLENTVIIGITDHYTYGYKNMEELYAQSGVEHSLLLEKTPCFVWSVDGPDMEVEKTLNTSDLVPTVLNLMGITSPYSYLGQDAFDPDYKGYAIFPDGSWICDGVAWQNGQILMNRQNRPVTEDEISAMAALAEQYITINNLLLTCNYYQ